MLKFVYIILFSCLLGFFTFQLSQERLPAISSNPISEITLPDSGFISAKKLPVLNSIDTKDLENIDLNEEDEVYYKSGDASMQMIYAIFQFVRKLYE